MTTDAERDEPNPVPPSWPPPWHPSSNTVRSVQRGRPITAEEGLELLDEINRLRRVVKLADDLVKTSERTDRLLSEISKLTSEIK